MANKNTSINMKLTHDKMIKGGNTSMLEEEGHSNKICHFDYLKVGNSSLTNGTKIMKEIMKKLK